VPPSGLAALRQARPWKSHGAYRIRSLSTWQADECPLPLPPYLLLVCARGLRNHINRGIHAV
jgi:hypothetical protein